jgi:hypothetical protein
VFLHEWLHLCDGAHCFLVKLRFQSVHGNGKNNVRYVVAKLRFNYQSHLDNGWWAGNVYAKRA